MLSICYLKYSESTTMYTDDVRYRPLTSPRAVKPSERTRSKASNDDENLLVDRESRDTHAETSVPTKPKKFSINI